MLNSSITLGNNLKRIGSAVRLAPVAALLCLPTGSVLAADQADKVNLQFDVYSGSLRIFKISMGMKIGDSDYAISTRIKSKGVASLFAKTKINMKAAGRTKKKIVPVSYSSNSKSKGKKRNISMTWNGKGKHQVKRSYKLSEFKTNSLARAVRPGMVDPLSYLMKLVIQNSKQPCRGSERVYDGRQLAEYKYSLQGVSTFNRSTGGVYRGKAFKCALTYRTIAGLSPKKQKARNSAPPSTFTVWFARVAGTGRNLFVPVAASGQVSGRAFTMRLSEGSVSGKPISKRVVATN